MQASFPIMFVFLSSRSLQALAPARARRRSRTQLIRRQASYRGPSKLLTSYFAGPRSTTIFSHQSQQLFSCFPPCFSSCLPRVQDLSQTMLFLYAKPSIASYLIQSKCPSVTGTSKDPQMETTPVHKPTSCSSGSLTTLLFRASHLLFPLPGVLFPDMLP